MVKLISPEELKKGNITNIEILHIWYTIVDYLSSVVKRSNSVYQKSSKSVYFSMLNEAAINFNSPSSPTPPLPQMPYRTSCPATERDGGRWSDHIIKQQLQDWFTVAPSKISSQLPRLILLHGQRN